MTLHDVPINGQTDLTKEASNAITPAYALCAKHGLVDLTKKPVSPSRSEISQNG
jgi:hypothetical protein